MAMKRTPAFSAAANSRSASRGGKPDLLAAVPRQIGNRFQSRVDAAEVVEQVAECRRTYSFAADEAEPGKALSVG